MNALTELFTEQVNRIRERKFHVAAGLSERDFIDRLIMPLKELLVGCNTDLKLPENRLPILIVIPSMIVNLSYQLESIRENIGDTQLKYIIKPEWFERAKGVSTPDKPYLLWDVETGEAMLNTAPKKCVEIFHQKGRLPLTIDEGLALVTHFPEVLTSHWIDLPGSVLIHKLAGRDAADRFVQSSLPPGFARGTFVPTLQYKYYDSLRLYYVDQYIETPYSGSASCARRWSQ
jgi:hypothetical protein